MQRQKHLKDFSFISHFPIPPIFFTFHSYRLPSHIASVNAFVVSTYEYFIPYSLLFVSIELKLSTVNFVPFLFFLHFLFRVPYIFYFISVLYTCTKNFLLSQHVSLCVCKIHHRHHHHEHREQVINIAKFGDLIQSQNFFFIFLYNFISLFHFFSSSSPLQFFYIYHI